MHIEQAVTRTEERICPVLNVIIGTPDPGEVTSESMSKMIWFFLPIT